MSNIIDEINAEQMTREVPKFSAGDTVVVQVRVKEGNRERLQAFEGVVIAKRNRRAEFPLLRYARFRMVKAWNACSRHTARWLRISK